MRRLKEEHYGIDGITGWRPWYELAVALAAELDDGVTIADPPPRPTHVTARKWRGAAGAQLLALVECYTEEWGGNVKREAVFAQLQQDFPHLYGGISLGDMRKNYHDAKSRHRGIKSTKRKLK